MKLKSDSKRRKKEEGQDKSKEHRPDFKCLLEIKKFRKKNNIKLMKKKHKLHKRSSSIILTYLRYNL